MAKRGFMGTVLHEMEVQAKANARARAAAEASAVREAARQSREAARAYAQQSRQNVRNAIEDEKVYKAAHIADQEAHVVELNLELEASLKDVDAVLSTSLATGGYFDPETLRSVVTHPAFVSSYQIPTEPPKPMQAPEEPVLVLPEAPKGLGGLFKKNEHAAVVLAAQSEYDEIHAAWQAKIAAIPMQQMEQMLAHANAEEERERKLALARLTYDMQCVERQSKADETNDAVDEFIAGLKTGKSECVEEYAEMVFTKSAYPENLEPSVKSSFDAESNELRIDMTFPLPTDLPQVKAHKYVKSGDSITATMHTVKDLKDRYNFVVCAMTLRSLHEVFDADRDGHIHSVSLVGGVMHLHEGLGKKVFTPLVHVALSRESFKEIDLSKVTPSETLKYLGGVVSKNLYALEPANVKAGVRAI